ncbi:spore germination protein GerPC [Paenibacillus sp. SI8]|uniref:spore germination protein GerPC n=1 Tax=unclassified Paenibacillus TaxID=185978 RepID=UPI0034678ADA
MHTPVSWQQWTQQLCTYMEAQKQRIIKLEQIVNHLEQTVNKLQAEVNAQKDQKRIHIDKIEYNFDQLKVEKLDGTLTIGISPGSLDSMEDFTVNGVSVGKEGLDATGAETANPMAPVPETPPDFGVQQQVSSGIEHYLQQDFQTDMRNLELKYQYPLDDDYKELILSDIRKQLDTRIQHYVNQYRSVGFKEPMESIATGIMAKTKQDILSAIESYIASLPRKDGPL